LVNEMLSSEVSLHLHAHDHPIRVDGHIHLAVTVLTFGTYGGIRKHFTRDLDLTSFVLVFESSMMAVAALIWLLCGCPMEYGDDWLKVVSIGLGGFCMLFADVMFLVTVEKLMSSTAMACYCGLSLLIGVSLDTVVEHGHGLNLYFLLCGCLLILLAILSMVAAEYLLLKDENLPQYESIPDSDPKKKTDCKEFDDANEEERVRHFNKWISIALISGVLSSLWSVFPAMGQTGHGAIAHPALVLVIFQAGRIFALPLILLLFVQFNVLGTIGPKRHHASSAPVSQLAGAAATGALLAAGNACYFFAESSQPGENSLSVPVAYALTFCELLVAMFWALFVFQ
jgi:hypothetical protein